MSVDIDWDEILDDADSTPRSILAELIGKADDIRDIIVIATDHEGVQRRWWRAEDEADVIAMLALAQFAMMKEANER